ncbi:hypothetical protein LX15_002921 [Streptoalloteichus tenebrarius]|uniref:Uncharacterized protein n=1 Tax=Streptoalloteichus tenebrarius (strain ATCC 17920 / DSM 40477 / JCM 4838 / CBS 697.72 / NBRC 16177 / NCIMB 11028 / NRRL B-12390 / A12253. 1 / ISP 5477) TaxID=1933 RepID=A0ABT1HUX4_STRSD|nr:hypothetical protein [Streptoalloteichus tenebrarius]BFF04298.1 hypothetical protein GCM10020241_59730 [Streptoalloteichus tenebrarius]
MADTAVPSPSTDLPANPHTRRRLPAGLGEDRHHTSRLRVPKPSSPRAPRAGVRPPDTPPKEITTA